ncbi:MAG: hypothetical protein NW226_01265 [Microscillaceae bacterium]|nr:hypothetical protein [Microscillaceae bacterium]
MAKWRLIFKALPFVLIILVVKIILVQYLSFEGFVDLQEVRVLLTAGVFLLGFMLAGTMADYKESEKIPGEISIYLESIAEISHNLALKTGLDTEQIKLEMLDLSRSIYNWLYKHISHQEMYRALSRYNTTIQRIDQAGGAPPLIGSLSTQLHHLRKLVTRTQVISNTGFLATGYALLELLIAIICVLLLVAKFENLVSEIVRVLVAGLIYIYMYMLIRDIDDPFEYKAGHQTGSAEVSLLPLEDYIRRLEQSIKETKYNPVKD